MDRSQKRLLGSSEDKGYLIIFDQLIQAVCNPEDDLFRMRVFLLDVDVSSVADADFGDVNFVLSVGNWTNFFIESPQAVRAIVLASFVNASLSGLIIRTPLNHNLPFVSLLDEGTQSWIVHCKFYEILASVKQID